jgi:hypothetical protein
MAQPHVPTSERLTPKIDCPRCRSAMRLAIIEPAAMAYAGKDTFVFECVCGFSYKKQPAEL